MLVCGIHDGHNAAAALVRDGRLLGALQEERPTRVKNWHGFPTRAIELLLADIGASWPDVDAFVFAGHESYAPPGRPGDREAQIRAYKMNRGLRSEVARRLRRTSVRTAVQGFRGRARLRPLQEREVARERIFMVEHHRCHATTAFYGPGVDRDALVVTLDGAGDGLCATVSVPRPEGGLQRLACVEEQHSIGILWALVTSLMGMVPLEHEYKLMGMAPYAEGPRVRAAADRFASAFELQDGSWRRRKDVPEPSYAYEYWREAIEFTRFDHVCGGLQLFTEEFISGWIREWLRRTGRRRLRLSGGVFMNVKLNKVIGELDEVDGLWVFPSCGDETNPIGAAWAFLEDHGRAGLVEPLGSLYLGVAPVSAAYDAAAEEARQLGFAVRRPPDLEEEVSRLLAEGEVVARFEGREEFGARALGNRSILADPSRREVVSFINRAVKSRDFWMPFACAVLEEAQERYIDNPKQLPAPYMILAFNSRNTCEIIAGCHPEDRTIRPQVVTRAWSPAFHRVLERFAARTGRGAVLNTSFNMHGEPIVSTPTEALDVLRRSGLRHLALGPYLVSKDAGPP